MNNATYEITDLNLVTEELANIKLKRRQGFETYTRKANVIIGSLVTAYSRIFMHENILKIQEASQFVLYSDTDSIIVAKNRNAKSVLDHDQSIFGKFKLEKESGSIKYFYSLGYVHYSFSCAQNKI